MPQSPHWLQWDAPYLHCTKADPSPSTISTLSNTSIARPTNPTHHPSSMQIQSAVFPEFTHRTDRRTDIQTERWARRQACTNTRLRCRPIHVAYSDVANNHCSCHVTCVIYIGPLKTVVSCRATGAYEIITCSTQPRIDHQPQKHSHGDLVSYELIYNVDRHNAGRGELCSQNF